MAELSDQIGSTEQIVKAVSSAEPGSKWAVGTEIHLVNRLSKELPDRLVLSLDPNVCVCTTMFRITPQHLCWVLENLVEGRVVNRIQVREEDKYWAHVALGRMLAPPPRGERMLEERPHA